MSRDNSVKQRVSTIRQTLKGKQSLSNQRSSFHSWVKSIFVPKGGNTLEVLRRLCSLLESSAKTRLSSIMTGSDDALKTTLTDMLDMLEAQAVSYSKPRRFDRGAGRPSFKRGEDGHWAKLSQYLVDLKLPCSFYSNWEKILCEVMAPTMTYVPVSGGAVSDSRQYWLDVVDPLVFNNITDKTLIRARGVEMLDTFFELCNGTSELQVDIRTGLIDLVSSLVEDRYERGVILEIGSDEPSISLLYPSYCRSTKTAINAKGFLAYIHQHSPMKARFFIGELVRNQLKFEAFEDNSTELTAFESLMQKLVSKFGQAVFDTAFGSRTTRKKLNLSRVIGHGMAVKLECASTTPRQIADLANIKKLARRTFHATCSLVEWGAKGMAAVQAANELQEANSALFKECDAYAERIEASGITNNVKLQEYHKGLFQAFSHIKEPQNSVKFIKVQVLKHLNCFDSIMACEGIAELDKAGVICDF